MASFAATGYRLPTGSSGRPVQTRVNIKKQENKRQRIIAASKAASNAFNIAHKARKNANKQKRNVSGGLVGYIKRRIPGRVGEQARRNRNNRLNKNLIKKANNANKNATAKLSTEYNIRYNRIH